ncbi:MAG: GTP cyclohydrolase FolE2 [Wenzhouxiangella sp.]|jgi:GTP cyclohydrolase I|nr:GTP cyclohydrolase FolE2 [Wenzhouxiangella sp.]
MASSQNVISMPDVASHAETAVRGQLDWVGMNDIELPIELASGASGAISAQAKVNAFVDLAQPDKRGIHMSRLYLHLDQRLSQQTVTPALLEATLDDFLASHSDLSTRAMVRLNFDYLVRRPSLISDNTGWKKYPFSLIASLDENGYAFEMSFQVVYSSTCPCSAALSRQLIQQQFEKDFDKSASLDYAEVLAWLGSEQGIVATPHSQRSSADVRLKLSQGSESCAFDAMIDIIEGALKTPVQAAVKREDEQAFALLNGQNLMFVEDSARRLQNALSEVANVDDFWARCRHFESLHPHDAVAIITKGVENGYKPIDGHPSGWKL